MACAVGRLLGVVAGSYDFSLAPVSFTEALVRSTSLSDVEATMFVYPDERRR